MKSQINLGLKINTEGHIDQAQWIGHESCYNFLKAGVGGGYIEAIHMPNFGTDMWVDEEFLFKAQDGDFAPNLLATKLLQAGGYPIPYMIHGPAVITGGTSPYGDTLGLRQEQIDKIYTALGVLR